MLPIFIGNFTEISLEMSADFPENQNVLVSALRGSKVSKEAGRFFTKT